MNIIQWLFQLLWKHVPIAEKDFAKLKEEAENWYRDIRTDEEIEKPSFLQIFKGHADKWYSKVFLAVSFIFADRAVFDYRNAVNEPDNEEELHQERYVKEVY